MLSLGELLVSGLCLAMMARYVPARMGGCMMGAYYVAVGISQYLGGVVANFACVGVALAVVLLPLMKKLSATHRGQSGAAGAPVPDGTGR